MRDIIPFIFWPWFLISCTVLLRRRVIGGSWRASARTDELSAESVSIEFPPPPPIQDPLPTASVIDAAANSSPETAPEVVPDAPGGAIEGAVDEAPADVMTEERETDDSPAEPVQAVVTDRPRSRTLAEALEGVAMPCDLAPLMGSGRIDPRQVAFYTTGYEAATVGSNLADEFEKLGFTITPTDDRSIHAERGEDLVEAHLVSAALTSELVMAEHHPTAPAGAIVVELKLA